MIPFTFTSAVVAIGFAAPLAFASEVQASQPPAKTIDQILPLVNQYCGACHLVPRPDVLPKRSWPAVIKTMEEIAQDRMHRAFIPEDAMRDITAFYYGSAPEELPMLPYIDETPASRTFVAKDVATRSALPFITNINAMKLSKRDPLEFLICDGEAKKVILLSQARKGWKEAALADIDVPVHTQVLDADDDGDSDILAADLGMLPPDPSLVGKLFLLRQIAPGKFEKDLIRDGLGRVADARMLDLDGDGDFDIAVAVFGGGDVGEVVWLENMGTNQTPRYQPHQLLKVSGAIDVSPVDLNQDGKIDLVSLIAQEHEMVVGFVGNGKGEFEEQLLARAPHPMYGSTSLQPVDLDRDGDMDLLFTNGDAFDAQTDPKPYHGVQWLENKGELNFEYHDIGRFYGASSAAAGDLDGDGDLDVVVSSWVSFWNDPKRQSLAWYENDGHQNFAPHSIGNSPPGLVSLQLIDANGDGALDIVAGALRMDLLLAKLGYSYKASRLFPPPSKDGLYSRVLVFENVPTAHIQDRK